jgi:hypothetical protein
MLNYTRELRAALAIPPGVLERHVPANTLPSIFELIHTTNVPDVWTDRSSRLLRGRAEQSHWHIPNLLGIPSPTRHDVCKLRLEVEDAWKASARLLQGLDRASTADLP